MSDATLAMLLSLPAVLLILKELTIKLKSIRRRKLDERANEVANRNRQLFMRPLPPEIQKMSSNDRFAMALAAIHRAQSNSEFRDADEHDRFPSGLHNFRIAAGTADGFQLWSDWGIYDNASFQDAAQALMVDVLQAGRTEYALAWSLADARGYVDALKQVGLPEWRAATKRLIAKHVKRNGFLAGDRVVVDQAVFLAMLDDFASLASWGPNAGDGFKLGCLAGIAITAAELGYISEDEAWPYLRYAAAHAKTMFDGNGTWALYAHSFRAGRRASGPLDKFNHLILEAQLQALLTRGDSPWARVDWPSSTPK